MYYKTTLLRVRSLSYCLLFCLLFAFSIESANAQCTWTASTVVPIPILDQANVSVGTNLYSFAGVSNGAIVANSYKFDGTTWTAIAPMPQPLEFPAAVTNGTDIFIVGGANTLGAGVTNLYRYNVATNTYTNLAPCTVGTWNQSAVFLNGKIYKFCGTAAAATNVLEIYDIATNTWTTGANYPLAMSFVSATAIGNFVYAAGGYTGAAASAKTYRYDPATNTWDDASIADLPAIRWGAAGAAYNGGFTVAGGYVGGAVTANISTSAITWDAAGNSWTNLPNMLSEAARMGGAVLGTSLYVIGGRSVASAAFNGTNNNQKLNCIPLVACSGTPTPGNTISSAAATCAANAVTLSLQNANTSGVTYQWQSATVLAGPYANITGATGSTYTTLITGPTYFRAIVTCTSSSLSGTSNPVLVTLSPITSCYCIPIYTNGCSGFGDNIARVVLGTLNNPSACTPAPYFTYYSAVAAPTVIQGATQPLTVSFGADGTQYFGAWIDYNQDGVFSAAEFLGASANGGSNGTISINFTVPLSSLTGTTRLRIRGGDDVAPGSGQACGVSNSTYGETEDYNIIIAPCVQGAVTVQPANATMGCGGTASFSSTLTGTVTTFQWEYRVTPTGPWLNVPNAAPYSGVNTNTLTITNGPSSLNGYQYRLAFSGPCTAVDFTTPATLTVTPYLAPISPVPAIKCTTSALQLFASPPPTVTTVCSPTLNLAVPDNNTTGVNTTLNVAGIAAGATISNINVKWNMTHTWDGDMVFVLKSPNGQILNLDYFLTQTGGTGATTAFVNTVVSSAGVNALSTGSGTYTGTFRADAYLTGAFGQAGPTGFIPTATTFAALTSGAVNGTWTLAMYDGGGGDLGVLQDWCINITWGVAPATAIFSPITNLWLDAAATIPYLGTAVNSVYTTTPTNITYTAIVSNGTCTSAPTLIPVTVTTPLTTVTVPATTGVCIGTSTTITATSATGTPSAINYVWQVSTDGGVTYTTVVNNATYSGATTGALTISNATNTLNNYRYRVIASIPACGSTVTSAPTVLTVNPNPTLVVSASPYTRLYPGLTTTLTVAASPVGTYTYTWFRNGVPVPGVTGNTLTVNVDQLGSYTVRANNSGTSCTTLSSATVIADSSNVDVFIYPSPNNGQFQVRYYSLPGNVTTRIVNVYDSKGARVYSKVYPVNVPYTRLDVDIRNYGKGIYQVELADFNGNRIKTGRVLVL